MSAALFKSRESDEHATPQDVYDELERRYGPFTLDVAATLENSKCMRVIRKEDDALSVPWWGRVWCNHPYSLTPQFVEHAIRQIAFGNAEVVVMLAPAKTGTRWWREAYEHADEVIMISGKLKFGDAKNAAPDASSVFVFRRPTNQPWGIRNPDAHFAIPTRHGGRDRWFTVKHRELRS